MKKVSSDVAYEYIRRKIINGEYPPGHFLMTEALSEVIKVSRTPVREALHKLQGEGVVTISPRLGASVTKIGLSELWEICELRIALEGYAAGLAALKRSQTDLREISYALEAMRGLTAQILASDSEVEFIDRLLREDIRFHIAVMSAAKNEMMKSEILRLNMVNRVMIGSKTTHLEPTSKEGSDDNRRKVLASHEEIYEAIEKGDSRASKDAMEAHVQDVVNKMIRAVANSGEAMPRKLSDDELAYRH